MAYAEWSEPDEALDRVARLDNTLEVLSRAIVARESRFNLAPWSPLGGECSRRSAFDEARDSDEVLGLGSLIAGT